MNDNSLKPAFPTGDGIMRPGITKREYFTAAALQGLLASGNINTWPKKEDGTRQLARRWADQTLKDLEENP